MQRNINAESGFERDGSPEEVAEAVLSELESEFAKIDPAGMARCLTQKTQRVTKGFKIFVPLACLAVQKT